MLSLGQGPASDVHVPITGHQRSHRFHLPQVPPRQLESDPLCLAGLEMNCVKASKNPWCRACGWRADVQLRDLCSIDISSVANVDTDPSDGVEQSFAFSRLISSQ